MAIKRNNRGNKIRKKVKVVSYQLLIIKGVQIIILRVIKRVRQIILKREFQSLKVQLNRRGFYIVLIIGFYKKYT